MNTSSLHALIIDQHMGELSPEVAELLETHLAQNAEAQAEAERIRQTLDVTQQSVVLHPELARVGAEESALPSGRALGRIITAWLAKAAAIALLAGLAGAGGYLAARKPEVLPIAKNTTAPTVLPQAPRKDSPWARYRIAHDSGGAGLRVVQIDPTTANGQ